MKFFKGILVASLTFALCAQQAIVEGMQGQHGINEDFGRWINKFQASVQNLDSTDVFDASIIQNLINDLQKPGLFSTNSEAKADEVQTALTKLHELRKKLAAKIQHAHLSATPAAPFLAIASRVEKKSMLSKDGSGFLALSLDNSADPFKVAAHLEFVIGKKTDLEASSYVGETLWPVLAYFETGAWGGKEGAEQFAQSFCRFVEYVAQLHDDNKQILLQTGKGDEQSPVSKYFLSHSIDPSIRTVQQIVYSYALLNAGYAHPDLINSIISLMYFIQTSKKQAPVLDTFKPELCRLVTEIILAEEYVLGNGLADYILSMSSLEDLGFTSGSAIAFKALIQSHINPAIARLEGKQKEYEHEQELLRQRKAKKHAAWLTQETMKKEAFDAAKKELQDKIGEFANLAESNWELPPGGGHFYHAAQSLINVNLDSAKIIAHLAAIELTLGVLKSEFEQALKTKAGTQWRDFSDKAVAQQRQSMLNQMHRDALEYKEQQARAKKLETEGMQLERAELQSAAQRHLLEAQEGELRRATQTVFDNFMNQLASERDTSAQEARERETTRLTAEAERLETERKKEEVRHAEEALRRQQKHEAEEARIREEERKMQLTEEERAKRAAARKEAFEQAEMRWKGKIGATNVGFDATTQDKLSRERIAAMAVNPNQAKHVGDIIKALQKIALLKGITRFTSMNSEGDSISTPLGKLDAAGKNALKNAFIDNGQPGLTLLQEATTKEKSGTVGRHASWVAVCEILGIN